MEPNWGKGWVRRPMRARTVHVSQLDDGDLTEMAVALDAAVAVLAADESPTRVVAGVDWPEIYRCGVTDLAITPDIVRDALSLFRLTDTTTSLRQPREWWRRLALAVQDVHSAIAREQSRRAGEERN